MPDGPQETGQDYNALRQAEPTLPFAWYHDADHHRREMTRIWRRHWIYVCRSDAIGQPLDYQTLRIGDQNIVVLRDRGGTLRAFHNACRHRGSVLCTEAAGRLTAPLLVCPYHQWSYAPDDGRLVKTSSANDPDGFDKADYGLFAVSVAEWRGSVFVNLEPRMQFDPAQAFQRDPQHFGNFPLEDLVTVHRWRSEIACNWKVFWENFNECLHCPNVHPELTDLVPLFTRRIINPRDLPGWEADAANPDPRYQGGMKAGAETWSTDHSAQGHVIETLTEEDLARGHRYATAWPSVFLGGYPDHVRIVQLLPLGPERMALSAEWFVLPETRDDPDYDVSNVVDFGVLVMEQDARACELAQEGLHAAPLEAGVLMPEEYVLKQFHDWVRQTLDDP